MQKEMLGITSSAAREGTYTGEESYALAGNQLWDLMVMKPFLFLQFGTMEGTKEKTDKLLDMPPYSKDRAQFVKEEVQKNENVMLSTKGNTQRPMFLFFISIVNLIIGIVMLIIAGAIIFYQLLFIILALMAPVILLVALVPSWSYIARDWLMKFIGTQLMKVALGLFLSLLFAVSGILYQATSNGGEHGDKGFLFAVALQIVLLLGIIIKRKDLFGAVLTPVAGQTGSSGATMQRVTSAVVEHYRKQRYMDLISKRKGQAPAGDQKAKAAQGKTARTKLNQQEQARPRAPLAAREAEAAVASMNERTETPTPQTHQSETSTTLKKETQTEKGKRTQRQSPSVSPDVLYDNTGLVRRAVKRKVDEPKNKAAAPPSSPLSVLVYQEKRTNRMARRAPVHQANKVQRIRREGSLVVPSKELAVSSKQAPRFLQPRQIQPAVKEEKRAGDVRTNRPLRRTETIEQRAEIPEKRAQNY